jgi:hypothetical protein
VRKVKGLAGTLAIAAVVLGSAVGCSDSPTTSSTAPTISQLQVQGAQRISGSVGIVLFSFDYADPDRDINRFVFHPDGSSPVTNSLTDATQPSGRVGVQQAANLPAPGAEVTFTVSVIDRAHNRSNALSGSYVAPP